MGGNDIFVGRQRELERFGEVLADPAGQAVVVVGPVGMGKTWLVNKMAQAAKEHPTLRCGVVRYELVSRDSVDIVMERMMDDAFRAGEVVEGPFDATAHRRKQWYALLETVVPKGDKVAKLIQSFQRDVKRPVREEFIDRLRLISGKMGENGRAIFVIDPWEYLAEDCAEDWAIVIRELPEKVKFVFAQRPEDAIAKYRKFMGLKNAIRVPAEALGGLDEKAVDELLDIRAGETKYTIVKLRDGLRRFGRHPYALQGAINLLAEGREIDTLPDDTTETGVIEEQWDKICACGEEAIRLFKALAILWVSVPDDVVGRVAEVGSDRRLALLASSGFLGWLIARDGDSGRLYHVLLAEYIGNRMSDEEKRGYHERAVAVYRDLLRIDGSPHRVAADRLPEHVLVVEGETAFVNVLVNECTIPLMDLGLLNMLIAKSLQALAIVKKGTRGEAMVKGNLGIAYGTLNKLDDARTMFCDALKISKDIKWGEGVSNQLGNLGNLYVDLKDYDRAENMLLKSAGMAKQFCRREKLTGCYSSLAMVYGIRGNLTEASKYCRLALKTEQGLTNPRPRMLSVIYGHRGRIACKTGDYDAAVKYSIKALKIEESMGRLEGIIDESNNLAKAYFLNGRIDKQLEVLHRVLQDNTVCECALPLSLGKAYFNLACGYYRKGEKKAAAKHFQRSHEIYESVGLVSEAREAQKWLEKSHSG